MNTYNPKKSSPNFSKSSSKKGGNITEDISKLAVPFGIILAKKALEKHLLNVKKSSSQRNSSVQKMPTVNKTASSPKKNVSKKKTPTASKKTLKQSIRTNIAVGGK